MKLYNMPELTDLLTPEDCIKILRNRIIELEEQNTLMLDTLISAYKGDIDEPSMLKFCIQFVTKKDISEVIDG